MARYMVAWELDTSRVSADIKERAVVWDSLLGMVEGDMKKGLTKDWAVYIGEMKGYSVCEGSELEIAAMCQKFIPFVQFEIHSLTSAADMRQMLHGMAK